MSNCRPQEVRKELTEILSSPSSQIVQSESSPQAEEKPKWVTRGRYNCYTLLGLACVYRRWLTAAARKEPWWVTKLFSGHFWTVIQPAVVLAPVQAMQVQGMPVQGMPVQGMQPGMQAMQPGMQAVQPGMQGMQPGMQAMQPGMGMQQGTMHQQHHPPPPMQDMGGWDAPPVDHARAVRPMPYLPEIHGPME